MVHSITTDFSKVSVGAFQEMIQLNKRILKDYKQAD